ncbi:response regulator transcription factor [Anaerocolumna sp. MB42-C2]|uniref:response regulator transcription factor n=1 Tax=Anaerocolumna sp. MB42-C2 TaxID=3070997 RepID=UPI0027E14D67|nr:response regulator transcription factor [Anaerocolumna sp. MB42-C2]WMJ85657.1 response regulator transcription factor [Anaerocolumna sp. MB42-C2]
MFTILIIEDNTELQNEVKELLTSAGYQVLNAQSRSSALCYFKFNKIDLCILDVQLPDCNGFEFCLEIRTFFKNPIIMLTVCNEEEDIITGLKNGADDYITKPFSIRILLMRVEAQFRRNELQAQKDTQIIFSGDLTINFDSRKIYLDEEEIKLRSIEFDLCEILLKNNGRIIKRELLFESIWDCKNKFIEENTLNVHISRLRKSLKTYRGSQYIETVKNYGYRWNVDIIRN